MICNADTDQLQDQKEWYSFYEKDFFFFFRIVVVFHVWENIHGWRISFSKHSFFTSVDLTFYVF